MNGNDTERSGPVVIGSELFQEAMAYYERHGRHDADLMHLVWDATPWVVEAYSGRRSRDDCRFEAMRAWCRENFGSEAFVIGDKAGRWQSGATCDGWTWFGFSTCSEMDEFTERWPNP